MQQLSALDTWFLHLENNRMPMHIGSLFILAPDDENRKFDFDEFKELIRQRIHLSEVFRRRVVEVPLSLGRPFWIKDPDFNLDAHLFHIALPQPATRASLGDMAAQLYNYPLDRSRPLWKMTFISGIETIENVPPNPFALLIEVHHASIDGMSGAELLTAIFDLVAQPTKIAPPKEKWVPDSIPSHTELIARGYISVTETPGKLFSFVKDTTSKVFEITKDAITQHLSPPSLTLLAPKTFFNVPVTSNKAFGAVDISLDRVKQVKNALGVKVNDVVLAICSAALRRYLLEKNELPKQSLVAMAPVSVRSSEEKNTMGNRISGMLVSLETNEEDPIERLQKIYANTRRSKVYSQAAPVDKIVELIPTEVGALASRFYTQMGITNIHRPLFNLIITNVPGPPFPLYMNGYRILNQYGLGITFEGLGLMIVVFSYAGKLSICATSCKQIMPEVHDFAQYIREGLDELENRLQDIREEEAFFKRLEKKYPGK